ncbi:MAG: amidohydrolase [Acidobacteria bacterium]|nr:amidohydrolase [Acidobacteriota bacterium]
MNTHIRPVFSLLLALAVMLPAYGQSRSPASGEVVIRGGTILTVTQGTIPNGAVLIRDGKIVAVGPRVNASRDATVIDAAGKYVTPGLIDAHGHIALDGDVNEATAPVTPHMLMEDAFQYDDKAIYRALAGGVTTSLLLHGSANMIGGQAVVIKHKFGKKRDELLFPGAPRSIKFASGENPKRVYGRRNQLPSTRMGNFAVMRQALTEAQDYMRQWEDYEKRVAEGKRATPPKKDLKLEALADVLRGKLLVQIHCYRADEFLTELSIAREFGYKIRAFHHALEAYKVAEEIAREGVAIATFADWWGYKVEAWDAIPENAALSMRKGVRVAIKSDSGDFVRRLNQEAAKTIKYGGATEDEAVAMITLNPAWIIGVENRVGSLEAGKDADIVIWDKHPLSVYARADKVLIDGEVYFDRSLPGYGLPFYPLETTR